MEARNERDRYVGNPLRLLRCAVELGFMAVRRVDEGLFDFPEFNETNFPPILNTESPVATEEELLA